MEHWRVDLWAGSMAEQTARNLAALRADNLAENSELRMADQMEPKKVGMLVT